MTRPTSAASQSQVTGGTIHTQGSLHSRSPADSLDEPISAGMRRRRSSSADHSNPFLLTPRVSKRLKVYATRVAEETGVSEKPLHDFIDTGGIYHMLIDLKVCMLLNSVVNRETILNDLKELLESKDFKSALQNRLTACMLSPNLTAYVTDTHEHIMDFIKTHNEVFKIPKSLFEDAELSTQFSTVVSDLLACIRGNLKNKLVLLISKHLSIMDTAKSLAHSCIEVDASHWNRYAFLRRCLRIFLIGRSDYKNIPLKNLYSPSLLPSLHRDLRIKVGEALDINMELDDEPTIQENANEVRENSEGGLDNGDGAGADTNVPDPSHDADLDGDEDENRDNGLNSGTDEGDIDTEGSGFGGNRKRPKYTSTKFWNFVDDSLEAVRSMAKELAKAKVEEGGDYDTAYEDATRNILVEYFQQDLAEFPGRRTVPKLLSTYNPQWQTTIQTKLLWTT
ncbi:hypothetical protein CY34DRAFT_16277 [Suillus luteus UH-Slu-Lm8-n1]|uniref:Uncharacterized protein n=1 Tax=Suillus luteus UH-Slu-Lm8-n1 TaxID=930992 RepID=A0A0D0A4P7_9AGAM|nr:hypothetical protein CY34DRAFT_16277 [Suillus luteus UH-Slu-Lm8-n1]